MDHMAKMNTLQVVGMRKSEELVTLMAEIQRWRCIMVFLAISDKVIILSIYILKNGRQCHEENCQILSF